MKNFVSKQKEVTKSLPQEELKNSRENSLETREEPKMI